MKSSSLLSKYSNQLWYFILIPLFFLVFVIIYSPFHIDESILGDYPSIFPDSSSRFQFNIVMVMCIIFLVLVLSRTLLYILRKKLSSDKILLTKILRIASQVASVTAICAMLPKTYNPAAVRKWVNSYTSFFAKLGKG